MTLKNATEGQEYVVRELNTNDEEMNGFLFTLGCFVGENITVVRQMKSGCVISVKDVRYNIDNELANAIII